MGSVPFDRIAERYDRTRGGPGRGRRFAAVLDGHLEPASAVLEIGVGTGLVAEPLAALGHRVTGIDLSEPMLVKARSRLDRLVIGDASRLPFAPGRFDAVVAVWAVHAIGDVERLVAEVRRVLRPGGRLLHVPTTPEMSSNDLIDLAFAFWPRLGLGWDRSEELTPRMAGWGFGHGGDHEMDLHDFSETPNHRADSIENRVWSSLWDLDDTTWDEVVRPVVDALRRLPEPDRPRPCTERHMLSVYALDPSAP